MIEAKVGDVWYIILPNTYHILEVEILDVTKKTVNIKIISDYYNTPTRYKIEDIEFVEHRI